MNEIHEDGFSYSIIHQNLPDDKVGIKCLQGATINDTYPYLPCSLKRDEQGKLKSMDIFIPEEKKLGEVIDQIPYGIMNKAVTGIGATTLEIKARRDSIIVVPTKSLAYDKYSSNEGTYYVGSAINEINVVADEGIIKYHNSGQPYKKFIVVADSLIRMKQVLGEDILRYFIMADEIDLYQFDVTFRPVLEDVLDVYFSFPSNQRAVVSATIREFSDPRMQGEPKINICLENMPQREIYIYDIDNVNKFAVAGIKTCYKNWDGKILIAYNSIKGIRQVIELLDPELKKECAIWCAEISKDKAGEYYEPHTGKNLNKRITFMTCAYFAGIDIEERYQSIIIINHLFPHTLLSPDRIKQIVGRCRAKDGIMNDWIFYSVFSRELKDPNLLESDFIPKAEIKDNTLKSKLKLNLDPRIQPIISPKLNREAFQKRLIKEAEKISCLRNGLNEVYKENNNCSIANKDMDKVLSLYTQKAFYGYTANIVRRDSNGILQPSYLNIDALTEIVYLIQNVYSDKNVLPKLLNAEGHFVAPAHFRTSLPSEQLKIENIVDQQQKQLSDDNIRSCIIEIEKLIQNGKIDDHNLKKIRRQRTRPEQSFLDCYIRLYPYIEHLELIRILTREKVYKDKRIQKRVINGGLFWALNSKHAFKELIISRFETGKKYTPENILSKMNEISREIFRINLKAPNNAVEILNHFCKTSRVHERKNGKTYYKIKSYNPLDIEGNPLWEIPTSKETSDIIDINNFS